MTTVREPDEDERREAIDQRRDRVWCKCGNPDWPGTCPGWRSCPCCQPDEDEDVTIGQRDIDDDALVALLADLRRVREGVAMAIEAVEDDEYLEAAE